ncbi:hypothetical protein KUTeg_023166 [Tegillarca granosa]|uniref:Sulfatase N-terminal domain-containing protein n=1 Tax=Tegillarca granosa TaxID=220873 RepID=A0ABQ9E0V0_TEGGR|nr:hypothetical protein KUTeg_023166 [Tegillarca granosa]
MKMAFNFYIITLCFLETFLQISARSSDKPNIVFILTDDQDVVIGGQTPIKKTMKLIGDHGMIFNNMYVSSPLCCPSRSSILTGKYVHSHLAVNNSDSGNCSSIDWQKTQETKAFPVYLHSQGYKTFFAGKYLNRYGFPNVGGVKHVPPGWDWWIGLVGNSRYYNYSLSVNGTKESHKDRYPDDYLTDVINRRATEFLNLQDSESGSIFYDVVNPSMPCSIHTCSTIQRQVFRC